MHYAPGGRVRPHFYVGVHKSYSLNQIKDVANRPLHPLSLLFPKFDAEKDLVKLVTEAFEDDTLPVSRYGFVTNPSNYSKGDTEVHQGPIGELNQRVKAILWSYAEQRVQQGKTVTIRETINS